MQLPIRATDRAHSELGWFAEHSSQDAIGAMLAGLRDANGFERPPLSPPGASGRIREMRDRFAPRRQAEGDVRR